MIRLIGTILLFIFISTQAENGVPLMPIHDFEEIVTDYIAVTADPVRDILIKGIENYDKYSNFIYLKKSLIDASKILSQAKNLRSSEADDPTVGQHSFEIDEIYAILAAVERRVSEASLIAYHTTVYQAQTAFQRGQYDSELAIQRQSIAEKALSTKTLDFKTASDIYQAGVQKDYIEKDRLASEMEMLSIVRSMLRKVDGINNNAGFLSSFNSEHNKSSTLTPYDSDTVIFTEVNGLFSAAGGGNIKAATIGFYRVNTSASTYATAGASVQLAKTGLQGRNLAATVITSGLKSWTTNRMNRIYFLNKSDLINISFGLVGSPSTNVYSWRGGAMTNGYSRQEVTYVGNKDASIFYFCPNRANYTTDLNWVAIDSSFSNWNNISSGKEIVAEDSSYNVTKTGMFRISAHVLMGDIDGTTLHQRFLRLRKCKTNGSCEIIEMSSKHSIGLDFIDLDITIPLTINDIIKSEVRMTKNGTLFFNKTGEADASWIQFEYNGPIEWTDDQKMIGMSSKNFPTWLGGCDTNSKFQDQQNLISATNKANNWAFDKTPKLKDIFATIGSWIPHCNNFAQVNTATQHIIALGDGVFKALQNGYFRVHAKISSVCSTCESWRNLVLFKKSSVAIRNKDDPVGESIIIGSNDLRSGDYEMELDATIILSVGEAVYFETLMSSSTSSSSGIRPFKGINRGDNSSDDNIGSYIEIQFLGTNQV